MIKLLKKFIDFLTNGCECGGKFVAWDDKRSYCNKCNKKYI